MGVGDLPESEYSLYLSLSLCSVCFLERVFSVLLSTVGTKSLNDTKIMWLMMEACLPLGKGRERLMAYANLGGVNFGRRTNALLVGMEGCSYCFSSTFCLSIEGEGNPRVRLFVTAADVLAPSLPEFLFHSFVRRSPIRHRTLAVRDTGFQRVSNTCPPPLC